MAWVDDLAKRFTALGIDPEAPRRRADSSGSGGKLTKSGALGGQNWERIANQTSSTTSASKPSDSPPDRSG
jgi:hypothetical protein